MGLAVCSGVSCAQERLRQGLNLKAVRTLWLIDGILESVQQSHTHSLCLQFSSLGSMKGIS